MPLILPARTLDSGYEISNSLRFNPGDSAKLNFTQGTPTSRRTWTYSTWVKRGNLGNVQASILSFGSSDYFDIRFQDGTPDDGIIVYISDGDSKSLATNRLFRDPSAWYHIVIASDTTDGTAGDRTRIYVNGVEETSFASEAQPDQNYDYRGLVSGDPIVIGNRYTGSHYFDGYLADTHFIDGQQLAPSNFGETNDNGVWIPKKYLGTYGTNGFKLEYKQTGTSANSSGIGADTSGNDHHFSVTNLAAIDVTTDTPTNNFATLNPLSATATAFTEGNVHATNDSAVGSAAGTIAPSNGKWYFEVQLSGACNFSSGVVDVDKWATTTDGNIYDYDDSGAVAVLIENTDNFIVDYTEDTAGGSRLQNSVNLNTAKYGFAVDLDSQGFYASANGNWYTGTAFDDTDFSNATNLANDIPAGTPMAFFVRNADGVVARCNFGNPAGADTISSGNADANGYGNFEYAVPSGYYALCTKNLAEYG